MNDMMSYINNWEELTEAKLGLEFEFFSKYEYIKTLELLNNYFTPVEIFGFNKYHSDFNVTETKWKIEPDYSGGSEMIELVTGPMPYNDAKLVISKVFNFIKKHGYTNEHSSMHINISFNDINVNNMRMVKFILNLNEDYIYEKFPNRKNNIYARSIKYILPFEEYTYIDYGMDNLIKTFRPPGENKYYAVNFLKTNDNYLEFRYIGGIDYETKKEDIFSLMNYFIMQLRESILEDYTQDDYILLSAYLEDNIKWYNIYSSYNEFLKNTTDITIEVDKSNKYEDICLKWDEFKDDLFNLIKMCEEMTKCTINYNTFTKRLEVIDTNINTIYLIKNVDFINCIINQSNFYRCDIIECEVNKSFIYNSHIYDSKINESKIINSVCKNYTELTKVTFDEGTLDCIFNSGIYRSGEVTPNADISSEVIMANKSEFWMISNVDNKNKFKK